MDFTMAKISPPQASGFANCPASWHNARHPGKHQSRRRGLDGPKGGVTFGISP